MHNEQYQQSASFPRFSNTSKQSQCAMKGLEPDYLANFSPGEILASVANVKLCAMSLRKMKMAPRTRIASLAVWHFSRRSIFDFLGW